VKSFEAGSLVEHTQCIANEIEGKQPCSSSDAMAIYEKQDKEGKLIYDASCFSCSQGFSPSQFASSSVGKAFLGEGEAEGVVRRSTVKPKDRITREEFEGIKSKTDQVANGYLGLPDEVFKFYGHRLEKDDEGNVVKEYYPETQDGKFFGMKYRFLLRDGSKCFGRVGWTGQASDLSGQSKFKEGGKFVLIVGGERDKTAAYHMLYQSQLSRGHGSFNAIPVVSPTTGETSAYKQLQAQYTWLDSFENIILGFDSDEAGEQATAEALKYLPREKVKIAKWSENDPFALWEKGRSAQFLRDFYDAKEVIKSGAVPSTELFDGVIEYLNTPRVTFPDYMRELNKNSGGGIRQGSIVNIIGNTSVGKSSFVNDMIYHWLFNSPDSVTPAVVSLEATREQYALQMMALHLGINLEAIPEEEAIKIISSPENKDKISDLWAMDYGKPRFHLIDERDGSIERLQKQVERLFRGEGCNLVVIDVLSDVLRFLPNDEQERVMVWEKQLAKEGLTFINIMHTRKPPQDPKAEFKMATEYDCLGTSSFVQSGHVNIVINRNKMSEDELERNTTIVTMPKCRSGVTGAAGKWYYDRMTRKIYNLEDWLLVAQDKQTEVDDKSSSKDIEEDYGGDIFEA
jgi:archaellum biogenesis ATPase FlaH